MPFSRHHVQIDAPPDTVVWKYFKQEFFDSFLQDEALFFRRVVDFVKEDKHEGAITELDKIAARNYFMELKMRDSSITKERHQANLRSADSLEPWGMLESALINCWTMKPHESSVMWKNYGAIGKDFHGVAVRSTVGAITAAFKSQARTIFGSEVRYIDHSAERFFKPGVYEHGNGNVMTPILHKNHIFSDENEYRLVHSYEHVGTAPFKTTDLWTVFHEGTDHECRAEKIRLDLDALIHEVILSPNATEADRAEVERSCRAKGLAKHVRMSGMV